MWSLVNITEVITMDEFPKLIISDDAKREYLIKQTRCKLSTLLVSKMSENSWHIGKLVCSGAYGVQYYLKCWKLLKLFEPQHNSLNGISVMVTKVEKIK